MNNETNPSSALDQIAEQLDQAALNARAVSQFSLNENFDLVDAYRIQELSIGHRLNRGEAYTGVKLGFTSNAKRIQMGIEDVIWGRLTDKMGIGLGGNLRFKDFIHPRVEPEIAFLLSKDVHENIGLDQVEEVIEGIAVALEIIDSRYENFKFSLEDVVADNCSSSAYVLGEWFPASTGILESELELVIDGETRGKGPATAIMGNPFQSLVDAIRISLDQGFELKKGHIILAGAATAAIYLEPGQHVMASATHLGEVHLNILP